MKGMKKLLSILMVLTLVLSLGATAFATTVTIDEGLAGHEFTAYRIFKGTQAADSEELASIEWGEGIDAEAFVAALNEMTQFGSLDAKDAAGVAKAISDLKLENKSDVAKAIAEAAAKCLTGTGVAVTAGTELDPGYYLIKDTTKDLNGSKAYNDVVLELTGKEAKIDYKTDVPTSEKKVQDINDTTDVNNSGWIDSADWDIGDHVPFQFTGTLPDNYGDYTTYAITFHDEQSDGLTFDEGSEHAYYVLADGTRKEIGKDYYTVVTLPTDGECDFEVAFADLKAMKDVEGNDIVTDATGKIVVEYTSELNTGAAIGPKGNPNEMYMEFSNNAHGEGTGTTPKDKVIVFTYKFEADKVDPEKNPLEGAAFTLLKKVATGGETVKLNEGTPYEKEYTGVKVVKQYTVVAKQTTFEFKGLDDGDYILVESTVPAGYNKADDVEFHVEATHNEDSNDPKLLTFTATGGVTANESDTSITGALKLQVENNKGIELPETGGIGTTIFYIAGAILVAGAVILLVTKKRVSGMEK